MGQAGNLAIVGLLTIASGLLDARGFVFAARAWPEGRLDPGMGAASLASFAGGLTAYILAVKFMQNAGIQGVALQSGIWFVVTAVGIAGSLSWRWHGWSSSWLVLERNTEESRSKL